MKRADYPKCATCAHMKPAGFWDEDEDECAHPDHSAIGTSARTMKPGAIRPEDASSYAAMLYVGPDFGCVNHSEVKL